MRDLLKRDLHDSKRPAYPPALKRFDLTSKLPQTSDGTTNESMRRKSRSFLKAAKEPKEMGDAPQSLEARYFFLTQHPSDILDACQTDDQCTQVRAITSRRGGNFWERHQ